MSHARKQHYFMLFLQIVFYDYKSLVLMFYTRWMAHSYIILQVESDSI